MGSFEFLPHSGVSARLQMRKGFTGRPRRAGRLGGQVTAGPPPHGGEWRGGGSIG